MGFTAILGNLITLRETVLVWYRMALPVCLYFSAGFLAWYPHDQKNRMRGV